LIWLGWAGEAEDAVNRLRRLQKQKFISAQRQRNLAYARSNATAQADETSAHPGGPKAVEREPQVPVLQAWRDALPAASMRDAMNLLESLWPGSRRVSKVWNALSLLVGFAGAYILLFCLPEIEPQMYGPAQRGERALWMCFGWLCCAIAVVSMYSHARWQCRRFLGEKSGVSPIWMIVCSLGVLLCLVVFVLFSLYLAAPMRCRFHDVDATLFVFIGCCSALVLLFGLLRAAKNQPAEDYRITAARIDKWERLQHADARSGEEQGGEDA